MSDSRLGGNSFVRINAERSLSEVRGGAEKLPIHVGSPTAKRTGGGLDQEPATIIPPFNPGVTRAIRCTSDKRGCDAFVTQER